MNGTWKTADKATPATRRSLAWGLSLDRPIATATLPSYSHVIAATQWSHDWQLKRDRAAFEIASTFQVAISEYPVYFLCCPSHPKILFIHQFYFLNRSDENFPGILVLSIVTVLHHFCAVRYSYYPPASFLLQISNFKIQEFYSAVID